MDYTIEKSILDQEGRYVILQAKIQDSSIILINYYAPYVEGGGGGGEGDYYFVRDQ